MPKCLLDDCDNPSRSGIAALCPKHYHRQYRHGDVNKVATTAGISASHGRRYRDIYRPGHPLASKHGKVYEHRLVLFEEIGTGPHACHWCSAEVDWVPKGQPGCLQVDHLNGMGDDNRPENLVPSCGPCNSGRGAALRRQALLDAGWWSENDTVARLRDPAQQRRAA